MSIIQGILLGLLQGVAEFLPISSSGHLAIVQKLFGIGEIPLLFDVFLHLATLCSVVLYFRKKIFCLLCAFGRLIAHRPAPVEIKGKGGEITVLTQEEANKREKNLRKYILAIVLATIVTGVAGIFSEKIVKEIPIVLIFVGFIITAFILIISAIYDKKNSKRIITSTSSEKYHMLNNAPSWWQSLIIGLAQGIGTLPGISRSGSTIGGSILCGVSRAEAGEFSFIVSIPAILGAFILELKDIGSVTTVIGIEPVVAGCAAAFACGFIALTWLMKIIKKGRLELFACYLIPVGILGIIFLH